MEKDDNKREVRIPSVGKKMCNEIKYIAQHIGVTQSSFLKTKLFEIVESYPDRMKKPMKED